MFLCGKKNNFNQSAKYVNSIWCKKKETIRKIVSFFILSIRSYIIFNSTSWFTSNAVSCSKKMAFLSKAALIKNRLPLK